MSKTLNDIVKIKGRIGWRGYTVGDLRDSGPIVIGANDITIDNKLTLKNVKHISREKFEESPDIMIEKYDILVVKVGSTIGKVAIVDFDIGEACINPNTVLLKSCKEDPNYLYYYLKSKFGQKFLLNNSLASAQSALNQTTLKKLPIYFPEIKKQKEVVRVIKNIDNKIELNNKINYELEEMVKIIYDYWFVQFDFPDKNGNPYKTSGGKMVWNKELKKEIPYGWGDKKLKDILKKNNKKFNLNGDKYNIDTIDLSVMPSSTMCLTEKNTSDKFGTNLFEMSRFDILFGGIRPYLLKAGFAPFDGLVTGTVHSFKIIKDFNYNFALLTITNKNVFKFAVSNSKGTKMPVISSDDLLGYKFAYEENIVKKFNELISFKEIISKNIIENHKLAELRDWLLPMLMNGQVSIK